MQPLQRPHGPPRDSLQVRQLRIHGMGRGRLDRQVLP